MAPVLVPVVLMVIVIIFGSLWQFTRGRTLLETWADENGLKIIWSERRWMFRGPFFWTSSKGQVVYYVTVADSQGRQYSAYVRCGGWLLGMLSDNVDVRWENGPPPETTDQA